MRKPIILTAAAIPTALGILIAVNALAPSRPPTTVQPPVIAASATAAPAMMAIVPAAVVDPTGEVFIGTGDGSGGGWVKPQDASILALPAVKPAKRAVTAHKEARLHASSTRPSRARAQH